jgi:type IV pilus assembly protein PilC
MPDFAYTAKDRSGRLVRSSIQADSRLAALATLQAGDLTVIRLEGRADTLRQTATSRPKRSAGLISRSRITLSDKGLFCRQLAISVSAGVPLRESLDSIAEEMENPSFRSILQGVLASLNEGKPFSEAISAYPRAFDALFISLIRVAEESGSLPQTLDQMAASLEKQQRLTNKIRSMTAYPLFMAAFFGIMTLIMTLVVLPRFQTIFGGFGSKLPWLTLAVFNANRFLIRFSPFILAAVVLLVVLWGFYGRTHKGRRRIDDLKLGVPLFGDWIRLVAVARFCRNLSMMVRGGVPIAHALEITSATCGNAVLTDALLVARERIMDGASIASSLAETGVFPRLVVQMVNVGETTGRLPDVLEKVSETYEERVEGSMIVAMSLFEPVVITVFGMVILTLVLAIYMPIFTVASRAQ